MTNHFSAQQLTTVRESLRAVGELYDIKPKGNEVMNYDILRPEGYKAYLVIKKAEGLSNRSIEQYKLILDLFLLSMRKPLDKITTTDIQLYLHHKQAEDNNQVTSVNNIRRILGTFFNWLYQTHWIPENPMFYVKPIRGLKKVYEPISPEQFEQIMGKIENQRDRALLAVIAGSGIRNGEACTMLRSRLDLEGKRFYVTGKGNKERGCFPTPRAKYELKKYLDTRTDDSPYVFVSLNKNHSQIHTHCIEAVLRKAGEKAGIHAYPHKLRHFFADNAHEAGIDVLDISRMLGHESVETTKIYMSLNTDDLAHKHNKLR